MIIVYNLHSYYARGSEAYATRDNFENMVQPHPAPSVLVYILIKLYLEKIDIYIFIKKNYYIATCLLWCYL